MWQGKLVSSHVRNLDANDPSTPALNEMQRAEALDLLKASDGFYLIAIKRLPDGCAEAEVLGNVPPAMSDLIVQMTEQWRHVARQGKP